MKGDREKCIEAGAWDYLSKPVDTVHLLRRAEELAASLTGDDGRPMNDDEDKVNILVVDDLPTSGWLSARCWKSSTRISSSSASGAEALRELLEREFAVILLDVNMPDIDGIETAELVRKHGKTAHTPIIFVTAYADEMQTERGYELGAVDYILSPDRARDPAQQGPRVRGSVTALNGAREASLARKQTARRPRTRRDAPSSLR